MSSQQDALYRAVCAFPDEDTPRLMFADLVEEEGDPVWAAFIRTQVELARVPRHDPLWAKCRQLDGNAIHGSAMAHTLPVLPSGFSQRRFRFQRGFAWRVEVRDPAAFASQAEALFASAPVQALDFDNRQRPDLGEFAACPNIARLHRLEFTATSFDADDLAPLGDSAHTQSLTELAFDYGAIDADGVRALARSPLFARLQSLELTNNLIPSAELVDALAAASAGTLRRLSLRHADLPTPDARHLFALPVIRGIEFLDLGDNPNLGPEGIEELAASRLLRGVECLILSRTLLGVPGVRAIAETTGFVGVRWLDLSANRLGPTAAGVLAGSKAARGLRVLDLSNNPLKDKGAVSLAGSPHLVGLVELVLADCDIGDAGALALAESPSLDGLLRLDLRSRTFGRRFGDEATRRLVERFGPCVSLNEE